MDDQEKILRLTENEFNYLLLEIGFIGYKQFSKNFHGEPSAMAIQKSTILKIQKLKELFESGL